MNESVFWMAFHRRPDSDRDAAGINVTAGLSMCLSCL